VSVISLDLFQSPAERAEAFDELTTSNPILLQIFDDGPAAFGEHGIAALHVDGAPTRALERIVATAQIVLYIIQCRLQLPLPLFELRELALGGSQTPRKLIR
jgi:hypothetical protein